MKAKSSVLLAALLLCSVSWIAAAVETPAVSTPVQTTTPLAETPTAAVDPTPAQTNPAATPAPVKRSLTELEQLVAPIALYPDTLIASILPAAAYPLDIILAARFMENTNNLPNLAAQPWDENVKTIAQVPDVLAQMNHNLQWTIDLGQAFMAQEGEVMTAIQNMRGKARQAGNLQSTPQQTVTLTNVVVEQVIEQQVAVVTNTIVQIQPATPEIIYVPRYHPAFVYGSPFNYYYPYYDPFYYSYYYSYWSYPCYVPWVWFGFGCAVGAYFYNDCDWHHGGVYCHGHGHNGGKHYYAGSSPGYHSRTGPYGGAKWKPDPGRLQASSPFRNRNSNQTGSGIRPGAAYANVGSIGNRPQQAGSAGLGYPGTGIAGNRSSLETQKPGAARPMSMGQRPQSPVAGPTAGLGNRTSQGTSSSRSLQPTAIANRPQTPASSPTARMVNRTTQETPNARTVQPTAMASRAQTPATIPAARTVTRTAQATPDTRTVRPTTMVNRPQSPIANPAAVRMANPTTQRTPNSRTVQPTTIINRPQAPVTSPAVRMPTRTPQATPTFRNVQSTPMMSRPQTPSFRPNMGTMGAISPQTSAPMVRSSPLASSGFRPSTGYAQPRSMAVSPSFGGMSNPGSSMNRGTFGAGRSPGVSSGGFSGGGRSFGIGGGYGGRSGGGGGRR
ncbi:MAG TPA: DUF3300 domain-containing protein [Candidatus Paceibacterota bacterium]|nr:DUF3300 domain-containing protein [Verrucomicrobiota bacterium]HRY49844.1 DUF3300 domain-containing protein [Candidatus Paceibacterota bacterium]HSA00515.1 DUF3300 domain-containing protein [Candidatus Paceibacterota bacterium]